VLRCLHGFVVREVAQNIAIPLIVVKEGLGFARGRDQFVRDMLIPLIAVLAQAPQFGLVKQLDVLVIPSILTHAVQEFGRVGGHHPNALVIRRQVISAERT
jgi:hypothetical protein